MKRVTYAAHFDLSEVFVRFCDADDLRFEYLSMYVEVKRQFDDILRSQQ